MLGVGGSKAERLGVDLGERVVHEIREGALVGTSHDAKCRGSYLVLGLCRLAEGKYKGRGASFAQATGDGRSGRRPPS